MKFRFPIFIIDEDYRLENASGLGIRALASAIEAEGVEVIGVTSYGDLSSLPSSKAASLFILSIDDEEFDVDSPEDVAGAIKNLRTFIGELRFRNADIPIYLYGETRTSEHIPNDILRELHGFIHMFEDTPGSWRATSSAKRAATWTACRRRSSASWSNMPRTVRIPGTARGTRAAWRSSRARWARCSTSSSARTCCAPTSQRGRRAGPTAGPHGPVAESELNAARIFHADHCFFVTNGTSTSNKVVWHANVAAGDVVVDRNCHKSILHAITMTGAIRCSCAPRATTWASSDRSRSTNSTRKTSAARSRPTRSRARR